jgi:hypothetical protein
MSTVNGTGGLPPKQSQHFYTAWSGAAIAGVSAPSVRRNIKPDAELLSTTGKVYGIYTRGTLEAFRAERELQRSTQADG